MPGLCWVHSVVVRFARYLQHDLLCWFRLFLCFAVGGPSCSNFLESTVRTFAFSWVFQRSSSKVKATWTSGAPPNPKDRVHGLFSWDFWRSWPKTMGYLPKCGVQ